MSNSPDDLQAALGNDYEIIRALGTGKAANVYLARDRVLGVLVAIKAMNPDKAEEETARKRFEREARSAASLADHPNIVAVSRFGMAQGRTPYLVMQYVKGRTMEERLQAEGRLSTEGARRVLLDVASALAVAHEKGIVHRDVRLGNVLWDEAKERALLTDFGIAAVLDTSGMQDARLTRTGQLLADPRYLTPEQLLDQGVSVQTDVYLFGILGYELLTGEGPFQARSAGDWINAHLKQDPRDLKALRPDVDPRVADLLRRCLAREPSHRPSAKDLIRALKGEEASASVPASQEGQGDLQALLKRRLPQIILVTAVAGGGLLQLMDMLVDRGVLPDGAFRLTLVFVVAAIVASGVISWFHGEKGHQRAPAIEYVLLSLIALGWLVVSVMVVMR